MHRERTTMDRTTMDRTKGRHRRRRTWRAALWAAGLVMWLVAPAWAAVGGTIGVQGVLKGKSGTVVVDGDYKLSFGLYGSSTTTTAAWTEGPLTVTVQGGHFSVSLGETKAIDPAVLGQLGAAWIGVTVASDPELPRQRVDSAPYALVAATAQGVSCSGCVGADALANGSISAAKLGINYAGSAVKGGAALDVSCTGCVSVSELAFDGDVDLGGNSLKAKNGTFSGDVVAKTITATTLVGDGSKLTGIVQPTGACKQGQVMVGIAADGTIQCGAAGGALPADGLDEVSNGLLTNQFVDSIGAKVKNVAIPDNAGSDANSVLEFPDIGVAQKLTVSIKLANTDFSAIRVRLLPPDDKKVGITLCDPCAGDDTAKELTLSLPPAKAAKGDLDAWVGKNPVGSWNLVVTDTSFCVPQKPGNAALCDTGNKTDGAIVDWSIEIQTLSTKKVATSQGTALVVGGPIQLADLDPSKVVCDAAHFGAMFASSKQSAFYVCNGKELRAFALAAQGTQTNPALSCWDIRAKSPFAADGVYWLDPDGGGPIAPFQALCDMTTDGGGWTLVWSNLRGGTGKHETSMNWATATKTQPLVKGTIGADKEKFQVYTGLSLWVEMLQLGQGELRYTWANDFGSAIDQAAMCKVTLNASANYTISLTNCKQLVGSTMMGLVSYHNNRAFRTIDNDATGCSKQYSNTPWFYVGCWDGSINGGGQNSGGNYYNGAYWAGSAQQWGADNGQGAGNGWIWVR